MLNAILFISCFGKKHLLNKNVNVLMIKTAIQKLAKHVHLTFHFPWGHIGLYITHPSIYQTSSQTNSKVFRSLKSLTNASCAQANPEFVRTTGDHKIISYA